MALPWTIRSMARRCGMGVTNFIHCSKQLTNATPMHYRTRCRLMSAAKLLTEQPERSATEIGLDHGSASGQCFATLFRRQFGATPSKFRITVV